MKNEIQEGRTRGTGNRNRQFPSKVFFITPDSQKTGLGKKTIYARIKIMRTKLKAGNASALLKQIL
jgi:hypothetical protein